MIISSTPLIELVPIQPAAMEGRFLCQWDKDSCDDARFVKIDFLALGMLSLVEECLELIVDNGKAPVDLSRIDFDDPTIYDMICAGDTIGIFQIESRAQIQMLPRTQPAQARGPDRAGRDRPAGTDRRRRGQAVRRAPPAGADQLPADRAGLRPPTAWSRCWQETHGVILYQEQVIEVAMALAGFTAGQADALRRVDDPQALARGDDRALGRSSGTARSRTGVTPEIARDGLQEAARLRRVRLPEGARGRVRRAGLSIVLAEVLLPGRVPLRAAQQPADGLLPARTC